MLNNSGNETILEEEEEEKEVASKYDLLAGLEESFLRKKSRIRWLKLGDHNTAFLFNSLKKRNN